MVKATLLAVALPGGINQGQVARAAEAMHIRFLAFEKTLLKRDGNVFGKTDADKAAGSNGIAILNQADSITGGNDFAGIRRTQRLSHRVR